LTKKFENSGVTRVEHIGKKKSGSFINKFKTPRK